MPVFTILVIAVIAVAIILILKNATKKNKGFLSPSETCAILWQGNRPKPF